MILSIYMPVNRLFFSAVFIGFFKLISAQITEQNYKIYSVKLAKEVSLNQIVDDFKNADVLFYGEEHNDSVTHYLEHKILELLVVKYKTSISLSMEMFERDIQPVMNEYLQSDMREKNFKKMLEFGVIIEIIAL